MEVDACIIKFEFVNLIPNPFQVRACKDGLGR
jgi:hypothetical protein